jgi:hypothetical protein
MATATATTITMAIMSSVPFAPSVVDLFVLPPLQRPGLTTDGADATDRRGREFQRLGWELHGPLGSGR